MKHTLFLLILSACLLGNPTHASEAEAAFKHKPLSIGMVTTLQSKYMDEERTINIYLPPSYNKKAEDLKDGQKIEDIPTHFPVLYVLDGSAHEDLLHIIGLVQFLNMYQLMPETIVVGIANVNRYRDFTTETTVEKELSNIPNAGGTPKFLDFVEKELQPFIEKNFRTQPRKTIIGQSLGGLLAVETLVSRPHLFTDYIIVSPSLWWNKKELLKKRVPAFLAGKSELDKKIYIAVGEEGKVMKDAAKELARLIDNAKLNKIDFHYQFLADENHATVLHIAAYHGLRKLNGTDKIME